MNTSASNPGLAACDCNCSLTMRPVERALLDAGDYRARFEWAAQRCAHAGLQLTEARRAVLEFLCARSAPVVVEAMVGELASSSRGHFVTFYRAVQRFEAAGLVRRISVAGHRAVRLAWAAADCLVCRQCGRAAAVADLAALHELEQRIAARTGYRIQYHWLEFAGTCHRCQRVNAILPL